MELITLILTILSVEIVGIGLAYIIISSYIDFIKDVIDLIKQRRNKK